MSSAYWAELPSVLVAKIGQALVTATARATLQLVCKYWRMALLDRFSYAQLEPFMQNLKKCTLVTIIRKAWDGETSDIRAALKSACGLAWTILSEPTRSWPERMRSGPTLQQQIFAHDWIELTGSSCPVGRYRMQNGWLYRNKLTFTRGFATIQNPGEVIGNIRIRNEEWDSTSYRNKLKVCCENQCDITLKLELSQNLAGELKLRAYMLTNCWCYDEGPFGPSWESREDQAGYFRVASFDEVAGEIVAT